MANRQKKLEKHRRRRQEKHRQVRVAQNYRIQDYLSDRHELYACYANEDWEETGMVSLLVGRRLSPGAVTFAALLVDYWGMGLKDAWGEAEAPVSQFEELAKRMRDHMGVVAIDERTVQHLVYGGIERAKALNFRLPKNYERWIRIVGTLPDGVSPDMSLFGKDGKIHIWCTEVDLQKRYLGDPKKLLQRTDIDFVLGDEDFSLMDDDEEGFIDEGTLSLEDVIDWCESMGIPPSPAVAPVLAALVQATSEILEEDYQDTGPTEPAQSDIVISDRIIMRTQALCEGLRFTEREKLGALSQIIATGAAGKGM